VSNLIKPLPNIELTRSEIEEEQRRRYANYGLQRNPFPLGGNFPEGYLQYTYLEDRHKGKIEDFLLTTFVRGEFNGMLILGEYGTGKSHILNYIHDVVNSDTLGIFEARAVAFLIQNPSVAPEDILISLLRSIKLGVLQDLIFLPIRDVLQEEYGDDVIPFLTKYTTFEQQMKLSSDSLEAQPEWRPPWFERLLHASYREFRRELRLQNIEIDSDAMRETAQDVLMEKLTSNLIIVNSLLDLILGDESKFARSWESLLASNIAGKRGKVVGVEFYLEAILKLFELMGIHHIYLLVDEIEDLRTQRLNRKAATEYLATLRRMIQHNYGRFSFLLASTRDAWNELKLYYPAIEDRFPVTIDLLRGSEEVKSVVHSYLNKARPEGFDEDQWFPFSEEAIDLLIKARGSILRHILTECRSLIDSALRMNVSPPIKPTFIKKNVPISGYSTN
jgi:hypothetical protein